MEKRKCIGKLFKVTTEALITLKPMCLLRLKCDVVITILIGKYFTRRPAGVETEYVTFVTPWRVCRTVANS